MTTKADAVWSCVVAAVSGLVLAAWWAVAVDPEPWGVVVVHVIPAAVWLRAAYSLGCWRESRYWTRSLAQSGTSWQAGFTEGRRMGRSDALYPRLATSGDGGYGSANPVSPVVQCSAVLNGARCTRSPHAVGVHAWPSPPYPVGPR